MSERMASRRSGAPPLVSTPGNRARVATVLTRMRDLLAQARSRLRYEPIERRVRASIGAEAVVDSTRAILVWEPRRVVPSYAVPVEDIRAELETAAATNGQAAGVLHPGIPFSVHTAAGEPVSMDDLVGADHARPPAVRDEPAAALLPAARGRPRRASPQLAAHLLPLQGPRVVLVGRRRRTPVRGPRLELREAAAGCCGDHRPGGVLGRAGRRVPRRRAAGATRRRDRRGAARGVRRLDELLA